MIYTHIYIHIHIYIYIYIHIYSFRVCTHDSRKVQQQQQAKTTQNVLFTSNCFVSIGYAVFSTMILTSTEIYADLDISD